MSLYDRSRKLIHLLAGKAKFATQEAISGNLSTWKATRVHLIRALGQGVEAVFLTTILRYYKEKLLHSIAIQVPFGREKIYKMLATNSRPHGY